MALTRSRPPRPAPDSQTVDIHRKVLYRWDVAVSPDTDASDLPFGPDLTFLCTSGGVNQVVARHLLKQRKLSPEIPDNELKMAPTTTNRLDIARLMADDPGLAEVLSVIADPEVFNSLFTDSGGLPSLDRKQRRALSRGMHRHRDMMVQCELIELVPKVAEDGTVLKMFLVAKAKQPGYGRLIGDARGLNARQKAPPAMGLPPLHDLIRRVLGSQWAAQADGKSYFYQFVLHPDIRKHFSVRLAGQRGKIDEAQMIRMCMGWKYAPGIGQHTSNFLMRDLGLAWVDDFLLLGQTRDDVLGSANTFRERLKRYNVEVDDPTLEPVQRFVAVGLEFDLERSRYRLDPRWTAKRASAARDALGRESITTREALRLIGALVWSCYATVTPLCRFAAVLEFLRRLCASSNAHINLDSSVPFPTWVKADFDEWTTWMTSNEWYARRDRAAPDFKEFVFSDASTRGAAWLSVVGTEVMMTEKWERLDSDIIYMAELRAMLAARPVHPDDALYGLDNTAVIGALNKGHSSSYVANKLLWSRFGRNLPEAVYIPTDVMPADGGSRGLPMPPLGQADAQLLATCEQAISSYRGPRPRTESAP